MGLKNTWYQRPTRLKAMAARGGIRTMIPCPGRYWAGGKGRSQRAISPVDAVKRVANHLVEYNVIWLPVWRVSEGSSTLDTTNNIRAVKHQITGTSVEDDNRPH